MRHEKLSAVQYTMAVFSRTIAWRPHTHASSSTYLPWMQRPWGSSMLSQVKSATETKWSKMDELPPYLVDAQAGPVVGSGI